MSDPSYVKLPQRLVGGLVADVDGGSQWSISGLDVRGFPEDPAAARFVRASLNAGKLEPATKAEWDEVHNDAEVLKVVNSFRPKDKGFVETATNWQESKVQLAVNKARAALEASRLEDVEAALDELDDERRAEVIEDQNEQNLGTDDPEEQVEKTQGQRPRKKSGSGKKGKGKS